MMVPSLKVINAPSEFLGLFSVGFSSSTILLFVLSFFGKGFEKRVESVTIIRTIVIIKILRTNFFIVHSCLPSTERRRRTAPALSSLVIETLTGNSSSGLTTRGTCRKLYTTSEARCPEWELPAAPLPEMDFLLHWQLCP